jgi:hypothetical protein
MDNTVGLLKAVGILEELAQQLEEAANKVEETSGSWKELDIQKGMATGYRNASKWVKERIKIIKNLQHVPPPQSIPKPARTRTTPIKCLKTKAKGFRMAIVEYKSMTGLARRLGVSASFVIRWGRSIPNEWLARVSEVTNIPIEKLMRE